MVIIPDWICGYFILSEWIDLELPTFGAGWDCVAIPLFHFLVEMVRLNCLATVDSFYAVQATKRG